MKKIISFSLFGDKMKYWNGAIENIRLSRIYYSEWRCRFYVCSDSDPSLINRVQREDCEIILVDPDQAYSGLFWRFYAVEDADIMISRDTDSRLSEREAIAVRHWLSSGKRFHIMRDHPLHDALMPAGMWGCRHTEGIKALIDSFPYQDTVKSDQIFLAAYIYPQIKEDAIIHDSYNLYKDGMDFPVARTREEFVGSAYDENGLLIKNAARNVI